MIGVCCLACPGFLFAGQISRRVYARSNFTDLYSYHLAGQYQRYLVYNSNLWGFSQAGGRDSLAVEFVQGGLTGKYSHLHEAEDRLELKHPLTRLRLSSGRQLGNGKLTATFGLGEGLQLEGAFEPAKHHTWRALSLGLEQQRAEVSYQIGSEGGSIPFNWNYLHAGLEAELADMPLQLHLMGIVPAAGDSVFDNRVMGIGGSLGLSRKLGNELEASLQAAGGVLAARLSFKGEEYGKLDNLRMGMLRLALNKTGRHLEAGMAVNGALTGSDEDSYFDIWPFTFWDTFLASRTRIKRMRAQLMSPEAGISYHWGEDGKPGWQGRAGIVYNHLLHHEDVIHKNRIVIVYPFFFGYETFHYDWHNEVDACLSIPVSVAYNTSRGNVYLQARQIAPFRWSKLFKQHQEPSPAEPAAPKARQWGGLSLSLGACWTF